MNCTTCGYALWNLRTRQCPECGEQFVPSQFEFITNSVAFCCPHCDQHYYGTGENGHLVPSEFHCVTCGEIVNMDQMVMRPAEGVRETETRVDHVPWLADPGWLKPLFKTIGMALALPHRLGRAMRPEQPLLKAWGFAAIVQFMTCLFMFGPFIVFMAFMGSFAGGPPSGGIGVVTGFLGVAAGYWLALMILIGLWGAFSHALLKITGETAQPISRTYECICYSSAAYLTAGVPCMGIQLGWLWGGCWWAISAAIMLKEAQRVSGWRAGVAGIAPPVLVMAAFIAVAISFIFAAVGAINTTMTMAPNTLASKPANAQTSVQQLGGNLWAFAFRQPPQHVAELIEPGFASPVMFIVDTTATTLDDIPLPGDQSLRLSDLENLSEEEQRAALREAAASLPSGVIAHRFGDFVFTYHGIDMSPSNMDAQLWLLIASPDPDTNAVESFNGVLVVGSAWGTPKSILEARFDEELAEQNRIRALHNLPPLPHPREVRHDKPAVGDRN